MNIKDKVKTLLKEADLYKSQSLLNEAKEKYLTAVEIIEKSKNIQNRTNLINAINKKVGALDTNITKWEKAETTPEVSPKVQDLIKNIFTPSSSDESKSVEELKSAITLAKFGQYKRAITEFTKLIPIDEVSVSAAKNALKCIVEVSDVQDAVEHYHRWLAAGDISGDKEGSIKKYLQGMIDQEGLKLDVLGSVTKQETIEPTELDVIEPIDVETVENDIFSDISEIYDDNDDDDIIDITSIGVRFSDGPKKGDQIELEVSFQAGNMLSLIVSDKDKSLVESLQVGVRLEDMDFYSPIAIFKGSGVVEANTRIESGPKKGNYSLDIKIFNT